MSRPRLVLIGAGLVGARHARLIADHGAVELAGIVDPAPAAAALARDLGVAHWLALDAVPARAATGAVIATPNARHEADGLAVAARGWGALIEKPLAATEAEGARLVAAFAAAGCPLLVGHHRRHHPFVAEARRIIATGGLGRLALVSVIWAARKPDSYFDAGGWRRAAGAGPVMINLIHDIDLLRHLCGDIVEVAALRSNALRGQPVEDSAAVALRLDGGAVATLALSDGALAPWTFEAASGENPHIAACGPASWRIAGTEGALELPRLRIWRDARGGTGDWSRPLAATTPDVAKIAPLRAQLDHFIDVLDGKAAPLVDGADALASLRATQAVLAAAPDLRAAA